MQSIRVNSVVIDFLMIYPNVYSNTELENCHHLKMYIQPYLHIFTSWCTLVHKHQVRSTRNRHECVITCMNEDEARGVCKDRSKWLSVVSAYPHGAKVWIYVCMHACLVPPQTKDKNRTMFWTRSTLNAFTRDASRPQRTFLLHPRIPLQSKKKQNVPPIKNPKTLAKETISRWYPAYLADH